MADAATGISSLLLIRNPRALSNRFLLDRARVSPPPPCTEKIGEGRVLTGVEASSFRPKAPNHSKINSRALGADVVHGHRELQLLFVGPFIYRG